MGEIEIKKVKRNINKLLDEVNNEEIVLLKSEINKNLHFLKEFPSLENFTENFSKKLSINIAEIYNPLEDYKIEFIKKEEIEKIYNLFKNERLINYKLYKFDNYHEIPNKTLKYYLFETKPTPDSIKKFSFSVYSLYYPKEKKFIITSYNKDFKILTGGDPVTIQEKNTVKFNIVVQNLS